MSSTTSWGRYSRRAGHGLVAAADHAHVVAFVAEVVGQAARERGLVLDDEHARGHDAGRLETPWREWRREDAPAAAA